MFSSFNVTPGALETLGIRLLSGRMLTRADAENRTDAVVVSASLAGHYWNGQEALGKRIGPEEPTEEEGDRWVTIVGVVEDIHIRALETQPEEVVYFSMLGEGGGRRTSGRMTVLVKTDGDDPMRLADSLRQAVWDLDAHLPISRLRTLDAVVQAATARTSFTVVLLMIAGAVSLLLGSVGTFAIVSYLVSQRTQEIGVRMAVGARQLDIVLLVMRQGLVLALGGTAVGVGAALVVTRWLESILFEIDPLDPVTFVLVPLLLTVIALIASFFPALRAAKVQPTVALVR
ncbi:MAG: FtsX-like permease family protein [Actinomycetia bacterium]|nr:FtsX-like permease family protein [Actinomycetes bacterium]